jgi:DNA-directed RNA polymerase sigma subunit (sigma70/sigma32)
VRSSCRRGRRVAVRGPALTRPAALSDHAVRALAQIGAARREHLRGHGTEPTAAQLSAATGLRRVQVDSLLAVDRVPRSMEEPIGADESAPATFGDTIADPDAEIDYEQVLDGMEIEGVRGLADGLDERERSGLWVARQVAWRLESFHSSRGFTVRLWA